MGNLLLFLLIIALAAADILRVREAGGEPCDHLNDNKASILTPNRPPRCR